MSRKKIEEFTSHDIKEEPKEPIEVKAEEKSEVIKNKSDIEEL